MNIATPIERQASAIFALSGAGASVEEGGSAWTQIDPADRTKPKYIAPSYDNAFVFGPFRLLAARRLLLNAEESVPLGSRAFDILVALVERRGELVTKKELMARVWPDTTVVEANLSVHVAALRRALGDGRDGNRYLLNIPGRGYRFIAPVAMEARAQNSAPLTPMNGSDREIDEMNSRIFYACSAAAMAPGVANTMIRAVALGGRQAAGQPYDARRLGPTPIADPGLVSSALAEALQVDLAAGSPLSSVLAAAQNKTVLLVLLAPALSATRADIPAVSAYPSPAA